MAEYREYDGSIFVVGEPLSARFEEFQRLVEELGLSTFVAFFLHKYYGDSQMEQLSDEEKEHLISECQPLIQEALVQGRPLQ